MHRLHEECRQLSQYTEKIKPFINITNHRTVKKYLLTKNGIRRSQ